MKKKWKYIKVEFEKFARHYIDNQDISSVRLKQAMLYSFLGGGKRVRALLCYTAGDCFNTSLENQHLSAIAIEAIHAYSLIHDDLPSMDDDNFRRERLACHIKFDEPTAILAGDALQSLAFQALSQSNNITVTQLKRTLYLLAIHAGSQGMVAGQQLDLDAESKAVSIINLKQIHAYKTGKMFKAAILLPFYLSSSYLEQEVLEHLSNFAEDIGLAFQVQDDIIDRTITNTNSGENTNSDKILNKATFPRVIGFKESNDILNLLIDKSKSNLSKITSYNTEMFIQFVEHIFKRNKFHHENNQASSFLI